MTKAIRIDFVSDIACPWCLIGLLGLQQAIDGLGDTIAAEIRFQPFELNPGMHAGGQNLLEHVTEKYGSTADRFSAMQEVVRTRAEELGFTMTASDRSRIYNTFDAHRLLHWAGLQDSARQKALKLSLFEVNFTHEKDPSDHELLLDLAGKAGLDRDAARTVLVSGEFADDVRQAEELWRSRGVNAVPAVIVNERYLISGGQPPAAYEQALREIMAET